MANIDLESLFERDHNIEVDNMEDVYEVDIDNINKESNAIAASQINNLLYLYNNKEFTDQHPNFKKRVESEIESLRKQIKITMINEQALDNLSRIIAGNPSNASLYAALDRLESKIIQADKEIKTIINEFNRMCTAYQTEINFAVAEQDSNNETNNSDKDGITSRGTKAFIEAMDQYELELFEDSDDSSN